MQYSTGLIRGNLASDPEMRQFPDGRIVANLLIIEDIRDRDQKTGEWFTKETVAHPVAAWGSLAQNVTDTLHKGDPVVFSGKVRPRAFMNKEGSPQVSNDIRADFIAPDLRWCTATVHRENRSQGPAPVAQAPLVAVQRESIPGVGQGWPAVAQAGPSPA